MLLCLRLTFNRLRKVSLASFFVKIEGPMLVQARCLFHELADLDDNLPAASRRSLLIDAIDSARQAIVLQPGMNQA